MNKKHLLNNSLSIFKKAYLCLFLTSAFLYGAAQTIPISSVRIEEATRDLQLLEKIPSNYSFNNRPFVCSKAIPLDSIYRWIDSAYFDKTQLNGHLHDEQIFFCSEQTRNILQKCPSQLSMGVSRLKNDQHQFLLRKLILVV